MRIQVFIREDLAAVLSKLAWRENRWPKQQAEWLLQQAGIVKLLGMIVSSGNSRHFPDVIVTDPTLRPLVCYP